MHFMHFPTHAALILFLCIFGHKIGVLKFPALFQGKELQSHPSRSRASDCILSQQSMHVTFTFQKSHSSFSTIWPNMFIKTFKVKMKGQTVLNALTKWENEKIKNKTSTFSGDFAKYKIMLEKYLLSGQLKQVFHSMEGTNQLLNSWKIQEINTSKISFFVFAFQIQTPSFKALFTSR